MHQVVNILLAGNAPTTLSPYLAGGNLTSLLKSKGTGWDVRPIVVGEILRRLVGKWACILTKDKASQFFNPFQFGVVGIQLARGKLLRTTGIMEILLS